MGFTLKQPIVVTTKNIEESLDLVREIFYEHVKYRFSYFEGENLHHRLRIQFNMLREKDLKSGYEVPLGQYKDGISLEREIIDTQNELEDYFFSLTEEFMDDNKKFEEYFKHALGGEVSITGFQFETITEYL